VWLFHSVNGVFYSVNMFTEIWEL